MRRSAASAFAVHAAVSGSWGPRLPAIKADLDLGDGQLGIALAGLAAGLIAGTRVAGWPIDRLGSRLVLRAGMPVMCATLLLPALAPDLPWLFAAFVVFGFAGGVLDVAINVQAVEVQERMGRPILSGLHGVWSVGLFAGAGTAAAFAAAGAEPLVHFAAVGAVLAVVSFFVLAGLQPPLRDAGADGDAPVALWTVPVLALGVVAYCSFAGEGAAADWSAVHLRENLGAAPGTAALGFAAFAAAMAAARFGADALIRRTGAVAVARAGGLVAAGGLGAGLLVDTVPAMVAGWALVGLGLAAVVPAAFGAAGALAPAARGRVIGRVAMIGYAGTITGPLVIGGLAEVTSLRAALLVPVALAAAIALLAGYVRMPGAARDVTRRTGLSQS